MRDSNVITFDQIVVGFPPGVAVLRREDADGLLVGLQRGVPDLLQLHVQLVHRQGRAVAVVHVQNEELQRGDGWAAKHGVFTPSRRVMTGRLPGSCEQLLCGWVVFFRCHGWPQCPSWAPGCDRMTGSGNTGPCTVVSHSGTPLAASHWGTSKSKATILDSCF